MASRPGVAGIPFDLTEYHLPSVGPYNTKFGNRANSNGSGRTPVNPSSHSAYESRRAFATHHADHHHHRISAVVSTLGSNNHSKLVEGRFSTCSIFPLIDCLLFPNPVTAASPHNPHPFFPRHGRISAFTEERNNRLLLCSSFPSTSTVVAGRRVPKLIPRPIVIKFVRSI